MNRNLGIYIHIPFCKQKCSYCDFISFANKVECIDNYIKALIKEINQKYQTKEVRKLYSRYYLHRRRHSFFY